MSGSNVEVLERVRIRCGMDERFRRRFDGYWISAMRINDAVPVHARIELMRKHL